jgi:hypothetical protein
MIQSLILVLLIITVVSAVASWRTRRQLLLCIRSQWGRPRDRQRDMEAISDLFRSHGETMAALDDRTWRDLLLDDVFAHLDRTESTVGQQMLYRRLRSAPVWLDEFEAVIARVSTDSNRRERAQVALASAR